MEVTRVRLGSVLEWAIAVACILAVLAVGSVAFREVRTLRPVTPVMAGEALAGGPPVMVPPRAVSVPMLLLADGTQLRVGDRASSLVYRLNSAWQAGADTLERSPRGDRVTRSYDDGATQFLLVFEPLDQRHDSRVVAIYVR
jgi:hypothetical protein